MDVLKLRDCLSIYENWKKNGVFDGSDEEAAFLFEHFSELFYNAKAFPEYRLLARDAMENALNMKGIIKGSSGMLMQVDIEPHRGVDEQIKHVVELHNNWCDTGVFEGNKADIVTLANAFNRIAEAAAPSVEYRTFASHARQAQIALDHMYMARYNEPSLLYGGVGTDSEDNEIDCNADNSDDSEVLPGPR